MDKIKSIKEKFENTNIQIGNPAAIIKEILSELENIKNDIKLLKEGK